VGGSSTHPLTFLFSDIEESTRLWEEKPDAMSLALTQHDAFLKAAIETNRGRVFKTLGDAFYAVFDAAEDAVQAALTAQLQLREMQRSAVAPDILLCVRMAIHSGPAEQRGGDYYGASLNRVARMLSVAHGGQVLLSQATVELLAEDLPSGATLRDLGLHRLKDLQRAERIYQLVHPALPADFPSLPSLNALPNNLPQQTTSFVGRVRELAEIHRLLKTTRLLTITGSGGAGKTRLALQVAAEQLTGEGDGVWLVPLAAVAEPEGVAPAVAGALQVRETAGVPLTDALVRHLEGKRLLLILDNCEHLLDACAALADSLLARCPGLRILATSQEPLDVAGEVVYQIPPLSIPQERHIPLAEHLSEYEAVRLFTERARAVRSDFAVTPENASALVRICRQLDGMPLALELAAARVNVLSVKQLSERLRDRFRLLTGGARTALPQHQTLRAAIDWSYALLAEEERRLFSRLSVFTGPFVLDAAESVCGGEGLDPDRVLDLLSSLVRKSLVVAEEVEGSFRYRLLESLKAYGREQLCARGEEARLQERHFRCYSALAEECEKGAGTGDEEAMRRLEAEQDNLRSALAWAQSHDMGAALRLGWTLRFFWLRCGYWTEGRALLRQALEEARDVGPEWRARALQWAGVLAYAQGDYPDTLRCAGAAVELYTELKDRQGIISAEVNLARVAQRRGDFAAARSLYESHLHTFRELGSSGGIAASLQSLGVVAYCEGEVHVALSYFEQSVAMNRELGNRVALAIALHTLGRTLGLLGEYGREEACYEESLALFQKGSGRGAFADLMSSMAFAAWARGDLARAIELLHESRETLQEIGARELLAVADSHLALVEADLGNLDGARSLVRSSVAALRATGSRQLAANALSNLGWICLRDGDAGAARAALEEALSDYRSIGDRVGTAHGLELLGWVAAPEDPASAARLLAEAAARRRERGVVLRPPFERASRAAITTVRAALGATEFDAAWSACALEDPRDK
jgi:predicted ATPase/class 3 adenylate cyclase